jgi:hypothetical protein
VLTERAAQIGAIERGASTETSAPDAGEPTIAGTLSPPVAQVTQASSISVSTNALRELAPRRARTARIAIAIAGAFVLVGAPVVLYLRARATPEVATPSATSSPLAASSTVPVEPSASASAPLEEAGAPVSPAAAAPTATATAAATPPRRAPRLRPNDCNPPFTWDAQGKKHYKASCL